jgi:hypothetical protein
MTQEERNHLYQERGGHPELIVPGVIPFEDAPSRAQERNGSNHSGHKPSKNPGIDRQDLLLFQVEKCSRLSIRRSDKSGIEVSFAIP